MIWVYIALGWLVASIAVALAVGAILHEPFGYDREDQL